MDILRTDFDAKFHTKVCCCCFSLKTGSTIIGVFNTVGLFISTIVLLTQSVDPNEIDNESTAFVDAVHGKTTTGKVIKTLVNILTMVITASMVYGNFKGDKKFMMPYVYMGLLGLILLAVVELIAVLSLFYIGLFYLGFFIFILMSILILFQLYYWEVVRCRVLELDQLEQPRSGYTQQDPELPAYGDIQGTTAMNMAGQEKSPLAYPNDQINYE